MKFVIVAALSAAAVGSAQAGCPFAAVGEQFAKKGAAPGFIAQDNFKGKYSQCDEFGVCTVVRKGKQNLQANSDGTGPSALSSGPEVCIDAQPTKKHTNYTSCDDAVSSWGGCNEVTAMGFCNRTCAVCSPVFVSKFGRRSGTPYDIEQDGDELALGAEYYMPKLEKAKCGALYPVDEVAAAALDLFQQGFANIAASVRMGFHDAGDFDKWLGTGGADGRFINSAEDWYGQSRSTNQGTVCAKQLLGKFKKTSLSGGDAVQICAIAAVEAAGGPAFAEFNFLPGRAKAQGVTNDGMLPNPNGNQNTLRDYYYRMGLNDVDIVALMGAHTLGGGAGAAGSGYTGNFTPNATKFDNTYFKLLVQFEGAGEFNPSCDYWSKTPAERGMTGGCHVGPSQNLQLPSDRALLRDPVFKALVMQYANDEQAWFQQYTKSVKKLSELGKDISVTWCNW